MQTEFGLEFPLIEAAGENVPLPDESVDLVHSEFGASLWADPYKWIPEAARLLRPGGELIFLTNSTLVVLCSPDTGDAVEQLVRPQFGMYRFEWADDNSAWNSTSRTATGFACCARTVSTLSTYTSCRRPRTR